MAREDTISFTIQEGQIYFFPSTKELTKTKQLLRKMLAGNAVIAALDDSLGLALTIGSNKEMQQMGSGGGGSFMPGAGTRPAVCSLWWLFPVYLDKIRSLSHAARQQFAEPCGR